MCDIEQQLDIEKVDPKNIKKTSDKVPINNLQDGYDYVKNFNSLKDTHSTKKNVQ